MMKNDGKIDESWKKKLNSLFGDDGWFDRFYMQNPKLSLFDDNEDNNSDMVKVVNTLEFPTPNIIEQDFNEILEAVSFVDKIIFGRTNYNAEISKYKAHKTFYNELSETVIEFCESNGIEFHIKDGTQTFAKAAVT